MYGSDVAILLIYGSHDIRHAGFRRLMVVNGTPREMGRHTLFLLNGLSQKKKIIFLFMLFLSFYFSSQFSLYFFFFYHQT